jgi:beta-galactosidase
MKRYIVPALLLMNLVLACKTVFAQGRTQKNIDFDWYFHLGEIADGQQINLNHSAWRKLDLPHDWSIEGNYAKENGGQMGFLPGGTGWYHKVIQWDKSWLGKKVFIEFGGVYMNSQVWINGHLLGNRPFGYIGFSYDLTPYLKKGENSIAVRVDNSKLPSARWYTGSGIYRHVNLLTTDKIHVAANGTFVRTPEVSRSEASVQAETVIKNESGSKIYARVISVILNKKGKEVARENTTVLLETDSTTVSQRFAVQKPSLWNPETPDIYYLKTTVINGKDVLDTYTTTFGIRKIEFDAGFGFKLNGERLKFKGVCEHQDMGPAGTAVPEDVLHRKLTILKEMGVNAIRVGHHPFSSEFYAMCDTMGIMVMDEAFDGWYHWENFQKAKWDYGYYFQEWWKKDLEDLIKRDRNHPSVMIWSLGNEVWGYEKHLDLQKEINNMYHSLDPTRPTTQAWATHTHLDIAGFNANGEGKNDLANFHKNQPDKPAIGTEIPHTRQTRGVYRTITSYNPWDKPDKSGHEASAANKANLYPIPDLSEEEVFTEFDPRYASGYDNQTRKISVRDAWKQVRDNDFYMGHFRWSGFDYLGEAWSWPSRTNNYGVIDLAGFPKDNYYLYQSFWSKKPMVHLLPHWTHPGKEGVKIPVVVYTNGDAAELFLNGKSLGKKQMHKDTLQIVWQAPYQPGTLLAVAYKDGKEIARKSTVTAGEAASIQLSVDRKVMQANRRDVVHVEVDITDSKGNLVPTARNDTIHFEVTGPYKLIGVENGDILDMCPQKVLERKAFMGKALLILQVTDKPGTIEIKATAGGLNPHQISVVVK